MKISNIFNITTGLGWIIFYIINLIFSIPLIYLTGMWALGSFFKTNTTNAKIMIMIVLLTNLGINYFILRNNDKRWLYIVSGSSVPMIITILFWVFDSL